MSSSPVRFFAGANTAGGFRPYPPARYDCAGAVPWRAFLLMGGPASGKSALLGAVLDTAAARGWEAETLISPEDGVCPEAVLLPERRVCVQTASAPYSAEPCRWLGLERAVSLDIHLNADALASHRDALLDAAAEEERHRRRESRYLGAAATLRGDGARIAAACLNAEKLALFAARLFERELSGISGDAGTARRDQRLLSAVTPDGPRVLHETLQALCARIYVLEDEYGVAADRLLDDLSRRAVAAGIDHIACPCPLSLSTAAPRLEHLLFPAAGVAFTTSNIWHKADFPAYRRIHATRFLDEERLRGTRYVFSFNRRAIRELLQEAAAAGAEARAARRRQRVLYAAAMDWEAFTVASAQLLADL